ncbi:MAG: hypothetical protein RIR51_1537 [Bacteroidota bacterium]
MEWLLKIKQRKNFKKNIFINCPFDNEYYVLLKPLIFSIKFLGLNPILSNTKDSGATRLIEIFKYMKMSKYSIHDLSRMQVKKDEIPRHNMTFECGMDFGLRLLFNEKNISKNFLIMDSDPHRFKQLVSDLAGCDIYNHENNFEKIIKCFRDWYSLNVQKKTNTLLLLHHANLSRIFCFLGE